MSILCFGFVGVLEGSHDGFKQGWVDLSIRDGRNIGLLVLAAC